MSSFPAEPPLGHQVDSSGYFMVKNNRLKKAVRIVISAGIAQSVERITRNDEVTGSIPVSGSRNSLIPASIDAGIAF